MSDRSVKSVSSAKSVDLGRFHARVSSDPLREAYKGRSPIIPWLSYKAVPGEEVNTTWDTLRQTPRKGKSVAYVHIPFCTNHCLFCNFYRNATRSNISRPYVDSLIRELERETNFPMVASGPIHAVYLGGGTPTDLDTEDLARLVAALRRYLPLAEDCEFTVESRVAGCTVDKVKACLDAGANRFSFGVQSFNTGIRQPLGRKKAGGEVIEFLGELCALDRGVIVCDLIFGLPNQTEETWMRDIEIVEEIGLDGVDLYALTLLPSSPLARSIQKGALPPGADVGEQARLYGLGVEALEQMGWNHMTSAHFSRETRERNLYNQLIKAGASCLAYGGGAGGSADKYSYMILSDLTRYHELVKEGKKPLGGLYDAGEMRIAKAVTTGGLEIGRLDLEDVEAAGSPGFVETVLPLVEQWEEVGLLTRHDHVLRLTLAGRFWHTNLISAFHHVIDALPEAPLRPVESVKSPRTAIKKEIKKEIPKKTETEKKTQTKIETMNTSETVDQEKQILLTTLREKFEKSADGILEVIANQSGLTTREVVGCLPDHCVTVADGGEFAEILKDVAQWGDILVVVHTPDVIMECTGPLPEGKFGHGFYNIGHGSPISGHLYADHCADICFVHRPFMGMETYSIQFFNSYGDSMFKIFVGRHADDKLKEDQVKRFVALSERYAKVDKA